MKYFNFRSTDPGFTEVRLRATKVSASNLSHVFQVNASSLYLQEHFGENIEFPNNGNFGLDHFPDNHVFIVMDGGNSRVNRTSGSGVGTSFSTPIFMPVNRTNTTSINSSRASVPLLHSQRAVRRTPIFRIKVVRADLGENDQPVNIHLHSMKVHISIYSEVEATVTSVESNVREEMREEDLVLVMANGLRYYDRGGTRGSAFWKIGSRKTYAEK